ncbi:hypothetical protein Pla123a_12880 [Posidoniimonas polymericola]|uniref:Uncharacterized protein n=1 Tax=Posidoniimonas polymericola TaxID=2528002 RepID=A0A5C5YUQ9_9BACT|nr:hypothetical protein [Posidoniimonas polymericola]TWT78496.1 hypothetical protein Pla123a_12880 [Posidoniimonas polymericola]
MPPRLLAAALLCLAALPAVCRADIGKAAGRGVDAVEIFRCTFDESWDRNYDLWPDKWKRATGPEYPHYVEMQIAADQAITEGRCLQVALDGASAQVSTPAIRVLPKFSYTLELKLRLEQIEHSTVTVSLDFMTADGEILQSHRSEPFQPTGEWVDIEMGKFRPVSELVDRVVAHLEIERGDRGDLQGVVSVADVWLGRWPSMEVTTNSRINVYDDPGNIVVTCSLSGISEKNPKIKFQLLDATQAEIGEEGVKELQGRVISEESRNASEILEGDGRHSEGYEGSEDWRPDIREHGFYRVRVQMISNDTGLEMDKKVITLAVVPKAVLTSIGEFGWSLPESVPRSGQPLDFATLQTLLPMAGVSWVKLPVWFPREETERGDQIIQFAERLAATDIETIGVLQEPERTVEADDLPPSESSIEYIFRKDPSSWLPLFDHVMNRLSLRLRWWQLGYDHDTSFVGHEDLVGKIHDIRRQLYRFGQDVRVGLGWRWDEPPIGGDLSWDFEQLSANPPLQSAELDSHLERRPAEGAPRWVLIEPLVNSDDPSYANERERHEARVREFIKQIIVAKKHGVDGIYVPRPFSGMEGVMNTDGTPGELLLPWRTAAMLLGGAEYMGSLQLPSGSKNWLFIRPDKKVVMVAWNDKPCDEVLYLGEKVRQIDVWGKQHAPEHLEHRQVIPVGPEPTFVLGVNEYVARWRMSVAFEKTSLPSVFGVEHENTLLMRNEFPFGIGGMVSLFVPDMLEGDPLSHDKRSDKWEIYPEEGEIKGATGLTLRRPLQIELNDAAYGDQPIRIDFEVNADRLYKFSVWRELSVGAGDIDIQAVAFLDEEGRLIVQQQMRNLDGPHADFKCLLYAPLRRRKRTQVFQLGAEPDIKTYSYSAGDELIGKNLTLRVEEIDGNRVLIYRFPAEQESDVVFDAATN